MANDQSTVTIETELDTPSGWEFGVRIDSPSRGARSLTLRMSWADFEHWSGGFSPPSTVAMAVVEFAMDQKKDTVNLGDFDAALLRRWFPDADSALKKMLQRDE